MARDTGQRSRQAGQSRRHRRLRRCHPPSTFNTCFFSEVDCGSLQRRSRMSRGRLTEGRNSSSGNLL